MKKILLASVAFVFVGASASFAAMPSLDLEPAVSTTVQNDFLILAKKGSDDGGGDDNGGDNGGGGHGSDDGDDSGDDNGGDRDDNASDDSNDDTPKSNSNDDTPQSNSNRRKPRIPGGSGCDDPGDVAEHAACR